MLESNSSKEGETNQEVNRGHHENKYNGVMLNGDGEDLGCWKAILLRRGSPTKKLTQIVMMGMLNIHWPYHTTYI